MGILSFFVMDLVLSDSFSFELVMEFFFGIPSLVLISAILTYSGETDQFLVQQKMMKSIGSRKKHTINVKRYLIIGFFLNIFLLKFRILAGISFIIIFALFIFWSIKIPQIIALKDLENSFFWYQIVISFIILVLALSFGLIDDIYSVANADSLNILFLDIPFSDYILLRNSNLLHHILLDIIFSIYFAYLLSTFLNYILLSIYLTKKPEYNFVCIFDLMDSVNKNLGLKTAKNKRIKTFTVIFFIPFIILSIFFVQIELIFTSFLLFWLLWLLCEAFTSFLLMIGKF